MNISASVTGAGGETKTLVLRVPPGETYAEQNTFVARKIDLSGCGKVWSIVHAAVEPTSFITPFEVGGRYAGQPGQHSVSLFRRVLQGEAIEIQVQLAAAGTFSATVSGDLRVAYSPWLIFQRLADAYAASKVHASPERTLWEAKLVAHDAWLAAGGCAKCQGTGLIVTKRGRSEGELLSHACECGGRLGADPLLANSILLPPPPSLTGGGLTWEQLEELAAGR